MTESYEITPFPPPRRVSPIDGTPHPIDDWLWSETSSMTYPPGGQAIHGPEVVVAWVFVWKGYSGGGRCDAWIYPDPDSAWQAAAHAIRDSYLDDGDELLEWFAQGRYREIVQAFSLRNNGRVVIEVTAAPFARSYFSENEDPRTTNG